MRETCLHRLKYNRNGGGPVNNSVVLRQHALGDISAKIRPISIYDKTMRIHAQSRVHRAARCGAVQRRPNSSIKN